MQRLLWVTDEEIHKSVANTSGGTLTFGRQDITLTGTSTFILAVNHYKPKFRTL